MNVIKIFETEPDKDFHIKLDKLNEELHNNLMTYIGTDDFKNAIIKEARKYPFKFFNTIFSKAATEGSAIYYFDSSCVENKINYKEIEDLIDKEYIDLFYLIFIKCFTYSRENPLDELFISKIDIGEYEIELLSEEIDDDDWHSYAELYFTKYGLRFVEISKELIKQYGFAYFIKNQDFNKHLINILNSNNDFKQFVDKYNINELNVEKLDPLYMINLIKDKWSR